MNDVSLNSANLLCTDGTVTSAFSICVGHQPPNCFTPVGQPSSSTGFGYCRGTASRPPFGLQPQRFLSTVPSCIHRSSEECGGIVRNLRLCKGSGGIVMWYEDSTSCPGSHMTRLNRLPPQARVPSGKPLPFLEEPYVEVENSLLIDRNSSLCQTHIPPIASGRR